MTTKTAKKLDTEETTVSSEPVLVEIDGQQVPDLRDRPTSAPRKYSAVAAKAAEARMHVSPGWKHANIRFVLGKRRTLRPGTVLGVISQIVEAAGPAGITGAVLAVRLRESIVNNPRSEYAQGKLPPIGWAEGWISNGAVKEGLIVPATA